MKRYLSMNRLFAPFTLAAFILLVLATPALAFDLTDLKAHWRLDEASGTRVDAHSTNDLTDNNTVTQAAGKIDNASQHVATNLEYLDISDNAALSTGHIDFTASFWVWFDNVTNERWVGGKGVANDHEWGVRILSTGVVQFVIMTTGGSISNTVDSTGAVSANTWYFFVVWLEEGPNTIKIQRDNGTVDSAAVSATEPADRSGPFVIGNFPAFDAYFDGRVDSFSFWKRLLTAGERGELYNSGNGLDYPFTTAAAVRSFGVIIYSASSALGGGIPAAFPIGGLW